MLSDSPDLFARQLEQLFQEALDLPPGERMEFVKARAGSDERLASAIQSLLRAAADEKTVWNRGALAQEGLQLANAEDANPDRYQLGERIGAGGMGVVYKAMRGDDEFAKTVAIKIVQWGAGEARLMERFRTERQILAALEHPNIARLLDGGTTVDGRPFLVMEYVEGESLDRYLQANRISLEAKLGMFLKICDGVACAHRNLVVHRDLKPSNILITPEGEPKLLDFGIARIVDERARDATAMGAMTPEYASPEQIANAAITTSSDIYSLGVILYEMLTDARPYAATSALELTHAVSAAAPKPMRGVSRDLEMIVQMAMRKEPARRYASVDRFAGDIQRYLGGFPVAARADTFSYRAGKFIGRNKVAVVAAILVLATVAGGVVSTNRQASIANRRFNDVRRLANSYLFEFNDAIEQLSGSMAARQLVARRAQEYLDSLAAEKSDDPDLLKELAVAYERLADVQGRREIANVGDTNSAQLNYGKALALRRQLYAARPDDPKAAVDLAHSLSLTGNDELGQRKLTEAEKHFRMAVAVAEKAAAGPVSSETEKIALRETLGVAYQTLGDVLGNPGFSNLGQTSEALQFYERALELFRANLRAVPERREKGVFAAATLNRVAQVQQYLNQGPDAVAKFREALAINQALSEAAPSNGFYRNNAAVIGRNLAVALVQFSGDAAEARRYADFAAANFENQLRADPGDVHARTALADSWVAQGIVASDPATQLRYYDRAVAEYDAVAKTHPGAQKPDASLNAYRLRTGLLLERGEFERALESARREMETDDRLLRLCSRNAWALRNQAMASIQIARVLEKQMQWAAASDWYKRSADSYSARQAEGIPIDPSLPELARRGLERLRERSAHP